MTQRNTMQKEVIYSALLALHDHPTADRVYDYVHVRYPSISRATVYRVLNQMAANGQILKVGVFNGADCFDHNVHPHGHARCRVCQRVFDVACRKPPVEAFSELDSGDFLITDYVLQFDGVCADCRRASSGT